MPDEFWIWRLVQETGWTLEYIDSLSIEHWHEWLAIRDAEVKAKNAK